jgi:N-acetylglutamate synthase-like GNAT family acetyltransferase
MSFELRTPLGPDEFDQYFDLRWRILRAPWQQARGSEQDEWEDKAIHIAAFDAGMLVGVGRLHMISEDQAQIRYMAVEEAYRGKGIARAIYQHLESAARNTGVKKIHVHARLAVLEFYELMGFKIIGEGPTLFNEIHHKLMEKDLIS